MLRTLGFAVALLSAAFGASAQDAANPETAAVPSAEAVSAAPDAPAPAALIARSREKLAGYRTLRATMAETIEFGPARRFVAQGVYLQGTGNRVNLDLKVEVGTTKGRLRQVSEGDVLWTVYEAGSAPKITRRDVNQILDAAKNAEMKSTWMAELGLGGLPALLSAIEGSIEFKPALTTDIDGRKFYVLEGTWKPATRAQFDAQVQGPPGPDGRKVLPAHVPELVRLYLDAESLFPYRIRYLKQSAAPGQEPRPLLTLDFRDIVVNAPVAKEEFEYVAPEGAEVADITNQFLNQLQARSPSPAPPGGQPGGGPVPGQAPPAAPQ